MREGPVPFGTNPPLPRGIIILSTKDETSRKASGALMRELTALGFDCERRPDDERPNHTIWILVEHRPEGAQGESKIKALPGVR
jgi:hypothetical protein